MRLFNHHSDAAQQLLIQLRGLSCHLRDNLQGKLTRLRVNAGEDLDPILAPHSTNIAFIFEGDIYVEQSGKRLYRLEEGDIIGLSNSMNLPSPSFTAASDLLLGCIHRDVFLHEVMSTAQNQRYFTHYLLTGQSLLREAFAQELPEPFTPQTGFLHVEAGATIIAEGDSADLVYTLIEGHAQAFRDGVCIGEIRVNEIFGALAVLTEQPRMASIVATCPCILLAVPKADFMGVIDHQPQVCLSIIKEMANRINHLNTQVIALQNAQTPALAFSDGTRLQPLHLQNEVFDNDSQKDVDTANENDYLYPTV